jgi:hypothetical protein
MTAVPEDCGPNYFTSCPRTRAELLMGHAPDMVNQTVAYSFSMRIPSSNPTGQSNLLVQLFQGYGFDPNGGKTVWIGSQNGRLFVQRENWQEPGSGQVRLDLGPISYDTWVNYSLVVYLSGDPTLGRVDVYIDGRLSGTITGHSTVLSTTQVTDMFLNVIDFNGVKGIADYDNVQISTGGVATPTLSTQQQ